MKKISTLNIVIVVLSLLLSAHANAKENAVLPSPDEEEEIVITLKEAGTLKEALSEVEATKIKHLTLKGPIDANDIKLIRAQEGRLSTLEVLDLKDVTELVPREKLYYYSYSVGLGDGLHSVPHYVCIGEHGTSTVVTVLPFQDVVYEYYGDLAYAFAGMNLKRVVWPSCLKGIGMFAMNKCLLLEEFVAPTNLEYIGTEAFVYCAELRKIPTLQSVSKMGGGAFYGCKSLTALDNKHEIDISSLDSIPQNAFYDCQQVESFVFSPDLKSIDEWAFHNCSNVRNVDIPSNEVTIGPYAFSGCMSLANVNLSEKVVDISSTAFSDTPWYNDLGYVDGIKYINNVAMEYSRGTTNLNFREGTVSIADNFNKYNGGEYVMSVNLPTTLRGIGENAFVKLGASSIILPSSLQMIGKRAFANSSLTAIEFPESLETIGEEAFYECSQLKEMKISSSVKKIGQDAFGRCALETLTLPSTIEEIGEYAFSGNTSLLWVNYNVPDAKGDWLFSNCTSLERVTLGEQVRIITRYSLNKCSNLIKITLPEGLEEIESGAFNGCKSLKTILLPNTLKKIGKEALSDCPIESISIPASIEEISNLGRVNTTLKSVYYNARNAKVNGEIGIFEGWKALEKVTFGEQVQVIPPNTFRLCSALKDVVLPEGLEEIGGSAFSYCASLTSIIIPKSVVSIGSGAFGSSGLTSVTIKSDAVVSKSYRNPERSAKYIGLKTIFGEKVQEYILGEEVKSIGEMVFCYCNALTSVTIPEGVTNIGSGAFQGCTNLSSIIIPNTVTSIGDVAFSGCTWLTSLTIGNGITSIGDYAFDDCRSLASVVIPNSVISIGDYAFRNCWALPSVTIPNSVTSLGVNAFANCSFLTSVIIGDGVTDIGGGTFMDCSKLTSVTIGNSVKSIGVNAFRGCPIHSLTIPNSVTSIGNWAFMAGGLRSIIIGNGITYIGNRAFDGNAYITDVYCYSKDVPEAEYNAFAADVRTLEGATLHVPKSSLKAYKTAVAWKDFSEIVPLDDEPIIPGDVTGNGSVNVQDATIVVNYILGTDVNDEYDYSAADMNNDGEIDVFDVTKMIAVILSEESSAKMRKTEGVQEPAITEQLTIENAANGIILKVDQANRFTSFQMDVVAPDGISLTEVHLSQNETDHIVRYAKIGENQYRVMALSMNSTPLQAYSDRLLELGMNEGNDVQIDNILFVTPQGEAVPFSILSDNITTDIKTVGISEAEDIYDLSGRKINVNRTQLPKGVYIINKKKVFIK